MKMKRRQRRRQAVAFLLILFLIFTVFFVAHYFFKINTDSRSQAASIRNAQSAVCPNPPPFQPSTPIQSYQLTYPALVPSSDGKEWLLFAGGIASQIPSTVREKSPNSRIFYPISQEEIWLFRSKNLTQFTEPTHSFRVLPETKVSFKQNKTYAEVFPSGFRTGCSMLPDEACNVQINDPSVVRFNGALYMYFTILENYRWYEGTYGLVGSNGPENPTEQNRHSIGLAVSADDGKNWAFVDKVLTENFKDSDGKNVLGAWAPSAVVVNDKRVDIYFHDALGTKQYVAQLNGGVAVDKIVRLNANDSTYRVNLDVVRTGNLWEMTYNDASFNVVRTYFSSPSNFGKLCRESVVVPADSSSQWATPHQVKIGTTVHLFFWKMSDASVIHHWTRTD